MVGCVCLHIASKLNEKLIISIDSYMECCLHIFTRAQFEAKESEVYNAVAGDIPTLTFYSASDFLEDNLLGSALSDSNRGKLNLALSEIIKDL